MKEYLIEMDIWIFEFKVEIERIQKANKEIILQFNKLKNESKKSLFQRWFMD